MRPVRAGSAWPFVLGLCAFALVACPSDDPAAAGLGEGCLLDSDCSSPLVCVFQRCHQQCAASRDCPAGQRCVVGDAPTHVCLLADEASCALPSECTAPLVCGRDGRCRDACLGDRDCVTGQRCASRTCADAAELGPDGLLPASAGAFGSPCSYAADCVAPMICRDATCGYACVTDADCPVPLVCEEHACQPSTGPGSCVPGKQDACSCPDKTPGATICQPDHTWGPCLGCGGGAGGNSGGGGAGGNSGGGGAGGMPATGDHLWSEVVALPSPYGAYAAGDANGRVLVAGTSAQAMTFGSIAVPFAGGQGDVFVGALAPDKSGVFATDYGTAAIEGVTRFASNPIGQIAIAAGITSPLGLGGAPLPPGVGVAVYAPDGTPVWSHGFGDPNGGVGLPFAIDEGGGVALDVNTTATIQLDATTTFGPGACIARYDGAGALLWYVAEPPNTEIGALAFDAAGDLLVGGKFEGTIDLGAGPMTSAGTEDAFVARLDGLTGVASMSVGFGADLGGTASVWGIGARSDGSIVTTGPMTGSVDLGGGVLTATNAVGPSVFYAVFDAFGTHVFSTRWGNAISSTQPFSLAVGPTDEVYLGGAVAGPIDFGGGLLAHGGLLDAWILELGPSNQHVFSRTFGDAGVESTRNFTRSGSGRLLACVVGTNATIDFGGGPLTGDTFLVELAP